MLKVFQPCYVTSLHNILYLGSTQTQTRLHHKRALHDIVCSASRGKPQSERIPSSHRRGWQSRYNETAHKHGMKETSLPWAMSNTSPHFSKIWCQSLEVKGTFVLVVFWGREKEMHCVCIFRHLGGQPLGVIQKEKPCQPHIKAKKEKRRVAEEAKAKRKMEPLTLFWDYKFTWDKGRNKRGNNPESAKHKQNGNKTKMWSEANYGGNI